MALYYNGQKVSTKSKLEIDYVLPEIDSVPTEGSENPVTSGGVYEALQNVNANITVDQEVIEGSTNPVSGGAVVDYFNTPVTDFVEAKNNSVNFRGKTITINDYTITNREELGEATDGSETTYAEYLMINFKDREKSLYFMVINEKKIAFISENSEYPEYPDMSTGTFPFAMTFPDTEDYIISTITVRCEYPWNGYVDLVEDDAYRKCVQMDLVCDAKKTILSEFIKKTDELYLKDMIQDGVHQTISASEKASYANSLNNANIAINNMRAELVSEKRVLNPDGETTFFTVPYDTIPGMEIDASKIGAKVDIVQKHSINGEYYPAYKIVFKKDLGAMDFKIAQQENYDFNGQTIKFTSVVQKAVGGKAYIYLNGSGHYFECEFGSMYMIFRFFNYYGNAFEFDYTFSNSEPQSCYIYDMSQYSGPATVSKFVFEDVNGVSNEISAEEFYNTCAEIYFEIA